MKAPFDTCLFSSTAPCSKLCQMRHANAAPLPSRLLAPPPLPPAQVKLGAHVQAQLALAGPNIHTAFVNTMDVARCRLAQGFADAGHHTTSALRLLRRQQRSRGGGGDGGGSGQHHHHRGRTTMSGVSVGDFEAANEAALQHVLEVIDEPGWEVVAEKHGVTVLRKHMHAPPHAVAAGDGGDGGGGVVNEEAAAKFSCVMARGTLNARAETLFQLFHSNERVHEYNDNCADVR
jgi:hypothetical protein